MDGMNRGYARNGGLAAAIGGLVLGAALLLGCGKDGGARTARPVAS